VLKDRLYTSAPKSKARRSAQTALWRLGEALVRLLAPIMSFTADEVWGFLPAAGRSESVHLEHFPAAAELTGELPAGFNVEALKGDWQKLLEVRDEALKALEAARNEKRIGGSLESEIRLTASESVYPVLERYQDQLRYLFIVSNVVVEKSPAMNGDTGLKIEVAKAPGQKCERCWNYSIHVGEDGTYPTVCERCSAVLNEIESAAAVG
jgi:isoleucyl-tRNA synthetase